MQETISYTVHIFLLTCQGEQEYIDYISCNTAIYASGNFNYQFITLSIILISMLFMTANDNHAYLNRHSAHDRIIGLIMSHQNGDRNNNNHLSHVDCFAAENRRFLD